MLEDKDELQRELKERHTEEEPPQKRSRVEARETAEVWIIEVKSWSGHRSNRRYRCYEPGATDARPQVGAGWHR